MSEPHVVGLKPWLPWPFSESAWWTEPVRAERLAALRIGVGCVLLLDVLFCYLPYTGVFFGSDSLGAPGIFDRQRPLPDWPWSLLAGVEAQSVWYGVLVVWALAAVALALGVLPRAAAALAWFIGGCVHYVNPWLYNGGDAIRHILLLYLILTPCGAVWSVVRRRESAEPVYVHPWWLRLIFLQMLIVYFVNGVSKLGPQWRAGEAIWYVTGSVSWTRWSRADLPMPFLLTQLLTWITLIWELTFPIFAVWPRTRTFTLCLGVLFHLGTGLALKLALFPLYAICFYLPLVPWERWSDRKAAASEGERLG